MTRVWGSDLALMRQNNGGLTVRLPKNEPCKNAYVIKVLLNVLAIPGNED